MSNDQSNRDDVEEESIQDACESMMQQLLAMGHDALPASDFLHLYYLQSEGAILIPAIINGHRCSAICASYPDRKEARILFISPPPGLDVQIVHPETKQLIPALPDGKPDEYKKSMN